MRISKRRVSLVALTLVALLLLPHSAAAGAPARPFSPTSPWYRELPTTTPWTSVGYTYGKEIAAEISEGYGHAAFNTYKYSPALYTVGPGQPGVKVTMWDCQNKGWIDPNFEAQVSNVPLPADAVIPSDSDAHVTVWQPATDTVWELWGTRRVDGQWQACWGGRLDAASTTIGTFPFPYGGTASGISVLAGLVTLDDLASGRIDHAIAIGVSRTKLTQFSWPANRTDGRNTGPTAIPEGQRLRLKPSIDLDALGLTPLGRMVARAMKRYGVIVRDTTDGVAVYAENASPHRTNGEPDPYVTYYGGKPKYAQLDGIPWNRLLALPLNYGRPAGG